MTNYALIYSFYGRITSALEGYNIVGKNDKTLHCIIVTDLKREEILFFHSWELTDHHVPGGMPHRLHRPPCSQNWESLQFSWNGMVRKGS